MDKCREFMAKYENASIWTPAIRKRTAYEIDKLVSLLKLSEGDTVLDLGCGYGRHALGLAAKGMIVTAVDVDEHLIAEARRNAREKKLKICYIIENMITMQIKNKYKAIIVMYNTLSYIVHEDDVAHVLSKCYDSLTHGGKMLISVFGREINQRVMKKRKVKNWYRDDRGIILEEIEVNKERKISKSSITAIVKHQEYTKRQTARIYSEQEMLGLLQSLGIRRARIYGDLNANSYSATSEGLYVLVEKTQ